MPDDDPQMDNNKHRYITAESNVVQESNNVVEITEDMLDNASMSISPYKAPDKDGVHEKILVLSYPYQT